MKQRMWLLYLAAVTLLIPFYFLLDLENRGLLLNVIGISTVVTIVLGARSNRVQPRLPWYLLAAGQLMFVLGDVIAYTYFGEEVTFPSIADPIYLSVYPLAVAGLLILIHQRAPRHDRASLIDSVTIAVSLGVLSWVFLIAPQARDASLPLLTRLTSIAYPAMDLLLLAVAVRLAVGSGRRGPSFYMLVGAVGTLFVTDSVYGWTLLHGGYEGGALDAGWIAVYALWGAAALHPSMRLLAAPTREPDQRLTTGRLALLASAALIPSIVTAGLALAGQPLDIAVLSGSTIVLFALVVARMAGLVHHNEQTVARERALREAGAALVTATSSGDIHTATMTAARALAERECSVLLYWGAGEGELELVATSPGGATGVRTLDYATLPDEARFRLGRRAVAEIDPGELALEWPLGPGVGRPRGYLAPLFLREELRGVLAVIAEGGIPASAKESLLALALDVALAIESAALTEDLLRVRSEARFRSLLQHSADLVTVVSTDMRVAYASPSLEEMVGFRPDELEGRAYGELVCADDLPRLSRFVQALIEQPTGESSTIELRLTRRDGTELEVEAVATNLVDEPDLGGVVLNTRDVTERKAFEKELTHQAFHDTLTGLPNRALFRDRVDHALSREPRAAAAVAVLFLDLDDFKTTNDTLGHAAGDEVLRQVGARLVDSLRGADTAARLGGDEFAILLDGLADELRASEVAERVIDALATPLSLDGEEISIGTSVGIAFAELDGRGAAAADELLRNADVAMYMAKERGKRRYQIFKHDMHAAAIERLRLKADLQRALNEGELSVHYQPIVALRSGRITGVEALVRWHHPQHGMVPPDRFIPLAEETGTIDAIGRMVLEQACYQGVILQRLAEAPEFWVSVNISSRQLQRPAFPAEVAETLTATGLSARSLVLELTESVMMEDMDLALLRLEELRELGVRLAVDDFGTGYSSLNYIRQFPLDVLKVDKSFIDELGSRDGEINAVTGAIIELAHILELQPVAEGIETEEQLERLLTLQCELGQGYLFHRPMPKDDLERVVLTQAEVGLAAEPSRS